MNVVYRQAGATKVIIGTISTQFGMFAVLDVCLEF